MIQQSPRLSQKLALPHPLCYIRGTKSAWEEARLRDCKTDTIRYKLGIATHEVQNITGRASTAVLHKEGTLYVAQCLKVGTASQSETVEDALANLKEATELYLEECLNRLIIQYLKMNARMAEFSGR